MPGNKQTLSLEQQKVIFETKAEVLATIIKCQAPEKDEAEKLAEMVNAAFAKLTP
ncbi:hypothetical protein [Cedecea sp. HN178]|uniref:hypothetical protein n=1 Tax=Cedecea sp. HN178 TaxID=3081237 RepID=UPI00301A75CF